MNIRGMKQVFIRKISHGGRRVDAVLLLQSFRGHRRSSRGALFVRRLCCLWLWRRRRRYRAVSPPPPHEKGRYVRRREYRLSTSQKTLRRKCVRGGGGGDWYHNNSLKPGKGGKRETTVFFAAWRSTLFSSLSLSSPSSSPLLFIWLVVLIKAAFSRPSRREARRRFIIICKLERGDHNLLLLQTPKQEVLFYSSKCTLHSAAGDCGVEIFLGKVFGFVVDILLLLITRFVGPSLDRSSFVVDDDDDGYRGASCNAALSPLIYFDLVLLHILFCF